MRVITEEASYKVYWVPGLAGLRRPAERARVPGVHEPLGPEGVRATRVLVLAHPTVQGPDVPVPSEAREFICVIMAFSKQGLYQ